MHHNFKAEVLKIRLDRFLAEQLPKVSRSQIQRDIENGLVSVNHHKIIKSNFVVRKGDEVAYQESGIRNKELGIKAVNIPLKILYNNHGLLIIDKPAGLAVHPGAGIKGDSLAAALLYHFKNIQLVGEEHRPGIVHRLDKDTSGVMLIALTPQMYEHLKDAFAQRKIKKEYIALVKGRVEPPHGFIDVPVGKSKSDFRKMAVKNMIEPKESLTEYKVLEYLHSDKSENQKIRKSDLATHPSSDLSDSSDFSDKSGIDSCTLLLVKLHTGRTHQIRVHMASIGHPLIGDSLYGSKKTNLPGLKRQFLHAKKIEVQLADKTWIEAESELAEDLKKVLQDLHSKIVNRL